MSGFPEDFEDEANPIEMREEEYIGVEEMEMDDFNQASTEEAIFFQRNYTVT